MRHREEAELRHCGILQSSVESMQGCNFRTVRRNYCSHLIGWWRTKMNWMPSRGRANAVMYCATNYLQPVPFIISHFMYRPSDRQVRHKSGDMHTIQVIQWVAFYPFYPFYLFLWFNISYPTMNKEWKWKHTVIMWDALAVILLFFN